MSKKNKGVRVKLIANPGSGQMAGNELLLKVVRCLQDQGLKLDVALAKPHKEALPIARKAVCDGYKMVIAMGGDDTVWAVMQGIVAAKSGSALSLPVLRTTLPEAWAFPKTARQPAT